MGRDVWLSSRMPPTKRTHQGPVLRGPEVFNYGGSHVMIFFWGFPSLPQRARFYMICGMKCLQEMPLSIKPVTDKLTKTRKATNFQPRTK